MSDIDILERLRKGDDAIFKEIYGTYRSGFLVWIENQFTVNRHESVELFQNAVVIMYDNVVSGKLTELTSSLKTYIFGIGRILALSENRNQKKKGNLPAFLAEHLDQSETNRDELFDRMYQALDQIDERCKSIIEQHYFSGLTSTELANYFGYKNADTAKTKKYKCLQKLIDLANK